jgi:hypothetical protein
MWVDDIEGSKIECNKCGLQSKSHWFRLPRGWDELIPFGCDYDVDETPIELPEKHFCNKCYKENIKKWDKYFESGERSGDHHKSRAEIKSAKKHKLEWINSGGLGVLGTKYFLNSFKYYPEKVVEAFKKLPYWGWCLKCGSERAGGYCGNPKCEDSFEYKHNK